MKTIARLTTVVVLLVAAPDASAGILSDVVSWETESDQEGASLGFSVATAGDVNRDNYSDVIVGAPGASNGQANEGMAFAYHGSWDQGLSPDAAWSDESNQAQARLGVVSMAGDVNGDGYSDVIVGAPEYDNGQSGEGSAFVYLGNNGQGVVLNVQQVRGDGSTPVQLLGLSGVGGEFHFRYWLHNVGGR